MQNKFAIFIFDDDFNSFTNDENYPISQKDVSDDRSELYFACASACAR